MEFLTPTKSQIADWARLGQKRARRERGLFLIEGEVCMREARDRIALVGSSDLCKGGQL